MTLGIDLSWSFYYLYPHPYFILDKRMVRPGTLWVFSDFLKVINLHLFIRNWVLKIPLKDYLQELFSLACWF